jgi:hypothetical protein
LSSPDLSISGIAGLSAHTLSFWFRRRVCSQPLYLVKEVCLSPVSLCLVHEVYLLILHTCIGGLSALRLPVPSMGEICLLPVFYTLYRRLVCSQPLHLVKEVFLLPASLYLVLENCLHPAFFGKYHRFVYSPTLYVVQEVCLFPASLYLI